MGRVGNMLMAVGSDYRGLKKVDGFNGVWRSLSNYPYAVDSIWAYSTVTFNEEMYIFGPFFTLLSIYLTKNVFKAAWTATQRMDIA